MRGLYDVPPRRLAARAGEADEDDEQDPTATSTARSRYQKMVREVLDAQRRRSSSCATAGEISNEVMHRLERELDLEDERLEI